MPKVTVLMPLLQGGKYLDETIKSVQEQTLKDWELLVVYSSRIDAVSKKLLEKYASEDKRINLLSAGEGMNQVRMMNIGIENSHGEYVARVELGCISVPERLEKQFSFMDSHAEIGLCGAATNLISTKGTVLRKALCDRDELKASMMFGCEISHVTAMLRKDDFDSRGLRYDTDYLGEYELWTRFMLAGGEIANLPEALVSCYSGLTSMDTGTRERFHGETRQLVMRMVSSLGVDISDYSPTLFAGWNNRPEGFAKKHPVNFLRKGYILLQKIREMNAEKKAYSPETLERILYKRWDWIRKSCGLAFRGGYYTKKVELNNVIVTVIMPVGKCVGTLSRAIDSICSQTCTDWELFLVQIPGQADGSAEIAQMYAHCDARIHWLAMDENNAEHEAIQEAIKKAGGKYISLAASDTVSSADRLDKQIAYLEEHEAVGLCGGWQHIFSENVDRIRKTATDSKVLKARAIFYGDIIPSTVMVRKELALSYGIPCCSETQDGNHGFMARIVRYTDIANIPVVLETSENEKGKIEDYTLAAEESGRTAGTMLAYTLGMNLTEKDCELLNEWQNPLSDLQEWMREQELSNLKNILASIWQANEEKHVYDCSALMDVVARKWFWVKDNISWQDMEIVKAEILEEIFSPEFKPILTMPYHIFRKENKNGGKRIPKVAALMPLFNGKKYIRESIESIQAQTFIDWEFYIVNDFGSNDGSAEIVKEYAKADERIILVQAERRLGLAASLNLGLTLIDSEYVARVDVDDPSEPERFAKQVTYMHDHPQVDLCSVWQNSLTPTSMTVQVVASEADELKAAMMFGCEISHCGVMLRKGSFDAHGWRYDPSYLGEDYELWTRAMMEGAVMVNLPEPLVTHRWGYGNISIDKGESLRQEVRKLSIRMVSCLGVDTERYDSALFAGWRNRPDSYARKNKKSFLKQGYVLLQDIWKRNLEQKVFKPEALLKILYQRWDWVRKSCGLKFEEDTFGRFDGIVTTPIVSVVMPTFNSADYISQAIDSIQAQTFTDWELIIINDFGSDDGIVELVRMYAMNDKRIHLLQTEERLGLAESLNLGMRTATGKYIARMDADDTSYPERFEKQVAFLEDNSEVGICGSWQRHYGRREWIHRAAPEPERQKARLIFWCDLCHSTLMLRREMFIANSLFYDANAQAEDYDLWSRAMRFMKIANIPEVLGDYRDDTGITGGKIADLSEESGRISARTLEKCLGMKLSICDYHYLNGWRNPISKVNKKSDMVRVQIIMRQIWERNEIVRFFDPKCLLEVLAAKYFWLKNEVDWKEEDYSHVCDLEEIFTDEDEEKVILENDEPMPKWAETFYDLIDKRIEVWTWNQYERINKQIESWTWDRYKRIEEQVFKKIDKQIERWTWERYQRMHNDLENNHNMVLFKNKLIANEYIPYEGSRVRVLFLFQMASFWPSWETLYNSCMEDERIEVAFCLLDEKYGDVDQMHTNKSFLEKNNIPYMIYQDDLLEKFQPHVVFLQTPYDQYHRSKHVNSVAFRNYGIRVVYITYGIEIADTESAHYDHFEQDVILNSWRIYTFSERMRLDYRLYSANGRAVRCCGHPKFDGLYHKAAFTVPEEYKNLIKGRKVILWHVHFPKYIEGSDGKRKFVTPYISEYKKFVKELEKNTDMFFVFLPHPKFVYSSLFKEDVNEIMCALAKFENCYVDISDDYRASLVHADAIISDRSALLIESGAMDVPVLYMSNADFYEPMTEAVSPLVESYEQGTACEDMLAFVERCRQGLDLNKEGRNAAFRICIPYFDGKCSERIKEDIVKSLEQESKV